MTRGECRDLAGRQRAPPDAGALHAQRGRAERFPALPFFLHKSLGRHGDAAGGAGLRARGKPATAFALLFREHGDEIALQVRCAAGNARLESPHEIGGDARLDVGRQLIEAPQETVQQTEFFLRELRRAGLDWFGRGLVRGRADRRPKGPVCGPVTHDDGARGHVTQALIAGVERDRQQRGSERQSGEIAVDETHQIPYHRGLRRE